MKLRGNGVVVVATVLTMMMAGVAHADDAIDARSHFERGTTYYDLGRFTEAAHEYEAAYEIRHEPVLLFNIGQAYRFAHEYNKAVIAFRSYLRHLPNADNRSEVEARIV